MGYHPRFEVTDVVNLITTRCRNSELWFANNHPVIEATLGYAAKYSNIYEVKLFSLAIQGNHIHMMAKFDQGNRAAFMRVFNSSVANALIRLTPAYPGGRVWGRRYSNELIPESCDVETKFFYSVLQAVQDGLCNKISEYPGYNCFHDAVWGIKRKVKAINWKAYNEARRWSDSVRIKDYQVEYELSYERLPGYENLSQADYAKLMHQKLEQHRQKILADPSRPNPPGGELLKRTRTGSLPRSTKTSTIRTHRPRIICKDPILRKKHYAWYFELYFAYKEASRRYRGGEEGIEFPPGTYKPIRFTQPTQLLTG